jgi:hypothetical protein
MADMVSFGNELERRIKTLPEFFQPIAYGAAIILFFMGVRGALVIFPIAVIYVLATSSTPLAELEMGAGFLLLAIAAGALSGLSYSLFGKYLRRLGPMGPYLAGIVTVAPYVLVLFHLNTDSKSHTLFQSMDVWDYGLVVLMSVLFGSIIGVALKKKNQRKGRVTEHAT